jgi:hypothetical protein
VHPADSQINDTPRTSGEVARLVGLLAGLRRVARVQLVVQRAGVILAALFAGALVVGVLDYVLRLPMPLRLVLWAGGLGTALWWAWRRVVPAARFSPSLTEVALRIEQSEAGRRAGLAGVLASGLELGRSGGDGARADLAQAAATRAAEGVARLPGAGAFMDARPLRRALGMLLAVAAPIVALTVLTPDLARIGWARVATPWTGESWPKRTQVVNATRPSAHALGAPIPLRALLTRTASREGATDVGVEYRVIVNGEPGPVRRALMTSQRRRATFDPGSGERVVEGELFERLLDTVSMGTGDPEARVELEYVFVTADDRSAAWKVLLSEPPAIRGASAEVTPPAYVADLLGSDAAQGGVAHGGILGGGVRDLGAGRDERAVLGPVLAGSRVRLRLDLNKRVPGAPEGDLRGWIARTLPGLEDAGELEASFAGARWEVSFRADASVRLPVMLVDEAGIGATEEATFRVDVLEDRPALAAVVEPPADESVLAGARIEVVGEGRDDVALAWVRQYHEVARPPAGSEGAPAEREGEPIQLSHGAPADGTRAALTRVRAGGVLDLAPLGLRAGDEVWLETHAQDALGAAEGREPSRSARRRLRVIGESEFVEQVRAELSGVRESAKRLAGDQERLRGRLERAAGDPEAAGDQARAQAALGERLTPMGDVLRRLSARVERNRLDDESLAGMLRDAQEFVDGAGNQSDAATGALDELAKGQASPEARAQSAANAEAAQRGVEEELTALANLLDRGQDSWAVRRELERLLAEQRQVGAQTRAAGEATRGRAPEQLTRNEREDLERVARRQREAGQRADAIVESLLQRAQAMEQGDSAQAASMRAAAARAQQEQLADLQRRAAEQVERNQTGQAEAMQAQAERAIERVLEELERSEARRDEQLRRALAEITESIERLIEAQTREIDRLAGAIGGTPPGAGEVALDSAMIALNQNTLGVQARVRETMRGATRLIDLLGAAGDAQASAIGGLRLGDLGEADAAERLSLARLRDALEEAQKMEEEAGEREAMRRRAELRRAYAEAAEAQAALVGRSEPLAGRELNRRERTEVRGLGEVQSELRERMAQVRSGTQELEEAKVFEFAHRRLDEAMARAAEGLRGGTIAAPTLRDQRAALRILQGLVRSLTNDRRDDEFREDDGGGGGGGGGGGAGGEQPLIPPLAELKLLRAMQGEAADLTRELDDAPDASPAELGALRALQQELARRARELLEAMESTRGGPAVEPGAKPEAPR